MLLAVLVQTTARRNAIPIDTLAFEYGVVNLEEREITSAPKEGVYVKGMFLEGMRHAGYSQTDGTSGNMCCHVHCAPCHQVCLKLHGCQPPPDASCQLSIAHS